MEQLTAHIIAFDIPYPPDYGGALTVYYELKALHELGAKIYLHTFEYGPRKRASELDDICHHVFYYERKRSWVKQLSIKPYIVKTRMSKQLMQNLSEDNFPILFEGIHTTGALLQSNPNRHTLVRVHNIESAYYSSLCELETSWGKKMYYWLESKKLKRFEIPTYNVANEVICISKNDYEKINDSLDNVHYIPPFHGNDKVNILTGIGKYALFHGNLSINDNHLIAVQLIDRVFRNLDYPLIIAGKNPKPELYSVVSKYKKVQLLANPDKARMEELLQNDQVNLIFANQGAGIKIKLINALFKGRHCIANDLAVSGSGLEDLVIKAESIDEAKDKIIRFVHDPFSARKVEKRKDILETKYSDRQNAIKTWNLLTKE